MQTLVLNRTKLFFLFIILLLLSLSCDHSEIDEKDRNFSISLLESKEHNSFIKEYSSKVSVNSDSIKITVKNAWLEKTSSYKGGKFISLNQTGRNLIIDLNVNDKLYLNSDNFNTDWVIATKDRKFVGQLRNVYGFYFLENELITDTIILNIYKLSHQFNIKKGLKKVGLIVLISK